MVFISVHERFLYPVLFSYFILFYILIFMVVVVVVVVRCNSFSIILSHLLKHAAIH